MDDEGGHSRVRSAHYQNLIQAMRWQGIGEKIGLVMALRETLQEVHIIGDVLLEVRRG